MCSYTIYPLLLLSLLFRISYAENLRYLEGGDSTDTEEQKPLSFKLTTLLEVNRKTGLSQSNLNGLIDSNGVKIFEENPSKIDGNTCSDLNEFSKDVVNALRQMNSEISKLKQTTYNIENGIESENIGYKTSVGVHYKRSSIKNEMNNSSKTYPKSCKEIFDNGNNVSGIYKILPKLSKKPFVVLCDMEVRGGGWAHVQNRYDGSQDFDLGWRDYKFGFGDLDGEFWIGLENLYKMTVQEGPELLVELEDRDGGRASAYYVTFKVGPEKEGYPLSVLSGYSGDAGDSLTGHLNRKFTTKDLDQDVNPNSNCAVYCGGGWWYASCHPSNLNGKYINLDLPSGYAWKGVHWKGFKPVEYSYAKSRMLIR